MQRFQRSFLACSLLDATPDELLVMHGGGDGRHASRIDPALPKPSGFCIDFVSAQEGSRQEGSRQEGSKQEGSNQAQPTPSSTANSSIAASAKHLRSSIRRLLPGHLPRYKVLRRLTQQELPRLYRSVDAFVLPSRGEGWGRPHVEAMAMGLPVVATNWSGPTAYLDSINGYPVPFTHLRPIPEGAFAGHLMAEPSERALAEAMRAIVREPHVAQARGRQARKDMVQRFSPKEFAKQIHGHIVRIASKLRSSGAQPMPSASSAPRRTKRQSSDADDAVAAAYDEL
jgi:glycosyltransferase involved in cell wall biosynthesis